MTTEREIELRDSLQQAAGRAVVHAPRWPNLSTGRPQRRFHRVPHERDGCDRNCWRRSRLASL